MTPMATNNLFAPFPDVRRLPCPILPGARPNFPNFMIVLSVQTETTKQRGAASTNVTVPVNGSPLARCTFQLEGTTRYIPGFSALQTSVNAREMPVCGENGAKS
jgi:hypothetical protein